MNEKCIPISGAGWFWGKGWCHEASNVIGKECEKRAREGCCGRNDPLTPAAKMWEFHIEIRGRLAIA
jgi:hypothetical protein